MEKKQPNRGKGIQIKFYVNEDEKLLIEQKFKESKIRSKSAFYLKSILESAIYIIDLKPVKEHTQELNKIGVNFNQLVRRLNTMQTIGQDDIETIKAYMKAIYDSENKFLKYLIRLKVKSDGSNKNSSD